MSTSGFLFPLCATYPEATHTECSSSFLSAKKSHRTKFNTRVPVSQLQPHRTCLTLEGTFASGAAVCQSHTFRYLFALFAFLPFCQLSGIQESAESVTVCPNKALFPRPLRPLHAVSCAHSPCVTNASCSPDGGHI